MEVVLDFQTFNFHTTCTFIHYKFLPQFIFCMPNLDFHTQLMNIHFELLHSGIVKLRPELYAVSAKC